MWRFTARESLLKEMNKAKEKKDAEIVLTESNQC